MLPGRLRYGAMMASAPAQPTVNMTNSDVRDPSSLDGYIIGVPSGTIDAETLLALLTHHLGPGVVLVPHASVRSGDASGSRVFRRHELSDAVRKVMSDGQIWLARDLAVLLQRPAVGAVLGDLVQQGVIQRIARGQYIITDAAATRAEVSPRLGLSGLTLAAFDALERPQSLAALSARLDLPRRDVANLVSRLLRRRLITRVREGKAGGFVFVYGHAAPDGGLLEGLPSPSADAANALPPFAAAALSAIPSDGAVRLTDIRPVLTRPSSAPSAIARLRKLGLVQIEGSQNRRIISLTEAGRLHTQYDALAPKARRLAALDGKVELAAGVLAVMAHTSTVRASELVKLRPAVFGNLRFDLPVWRLVKRGLAEQVEDTRGRNRLYRLTAQGRAYAEELQREAILPPGPEIRVFVARFLGTATVAANRPPSLAAEPCRQAILSFARDHGLVTAKDAARHIGPQAPGLSVIYGHLRTLEARGAIRSVEVAGGGRAPLVWRYVIPAGRGAGAAG